VRREVAAWCLVAWQAAGGVQFEAAPAERTGIAWRHENGASAAKHLPETVGAGVAVLDFDGDGRMDLFFVNSGPADFFRPPRPLRHGLYRNKGDWTFEDATEASGIQSAGYGMGAAAADYDGDGRTDLLITNYGGLQLYRNRGDGKFEDVTKQAGLARGGWFTHAVFFDFDGDGKLDLFVSSFVEYTPEMNRQCGDPTGERMHYCIPRIFRPTANLLYRNVGGGRFEDVSVGSGIRAAAGKSFAAVATDVNNDGRPDLFVANDTVANFLFVNQGEGRFEERGLVAGVAYGENGEPRSGMGVDAADVDGDGWEDLFVANIDQEMFSLYRNRDGVEFADEHEEIRRATRLLSGWGLRFFDYDNDGDPDLLLVNGHPDDMVETIKPLVTFAEPMLLFRNDGGRMREVSGESGAVFRERFAGRGMATADLDNDGDLDVVATENGGPPRLLRNEGGNRKGWVGLELVATQSNVAGAGAILRWSVGGKTFRRQRNSGGSYLSAHDPRELLGLGDGGQAEWVEIRWPSGTVDRLERPAAGRYHRVVEGRGLQASR
jgi:hypothetical protein